MLKKTYTDYFDRRRGQWTEVKIEPAKITVLPSRAKPHWLAVVFGIAIVAFLIAGLVQSPMGWIMLLCIVLMLIWQYFGRSPRPAIVINSLPPRRDHAATATEDQNPWQYSEKSTDTSHHVAQVQQFIIRENTSRDKSEDTHLLQIYMELEGEEKLVLLYQDYFADKRNEQTQEIFRNMSNWLESAREVEAPSETYD